MKSKKAYREQVKYFHPDSKNVSPELAEEKTKELNAAYAVLGYLEKKRVYDYQLKCEQGFYSQPNQNSYANSFNGNYSKTSTNYNNYAYRSYSSVNKNTSNEDRTKAIRKAILWIAFVILFCVIINNQGLSKSVNSSNSYSGSNITSSSTKSGQTNDLDANLTPVSISNGTMFKKPIDEANCALKVVTSGSNGYYIYLKDIKNNGRNDISFYVKGGNTVSVDVPVGTYKLYYASGPTWYGTKNKFGSKTAYTTSDDYFVFSSTIEGNYIYYDVWEVTLYPVTNGNMRTENINEDDFPG